MNLKGILVIKNGFIYYLISFTVGGVLLSFELLNARFIAPYFGHSFYVWASTIGTTMLGLALGYHISGRVIDGKTPISVMIFRALALLGIYIIVLPFYGGFLLKALSGMEVLSGIVVATTLFNLPLFTLFGLFSPLIIEQLTVQLSMTGNVAGKVYGLSTVGGVLFILITGIYLLPDAGLKASMIGHGVLIVLLAALHYANSKSEMKKSVDREE